VSSVLVGNGYQSTDQPSGRAQGQGKGRVGSSKTLPEKHKTRKAEYTKKVFGCLNQLYPGWDGPADGLILDEMVQVNCLVACIK
jgi:hypothetical protein